MNRPAEGPTSLDATVLAGLAQTGIPSAAVLITRPGRPVRVSARGWAVTHDERGPLAAPIAVRPDTLFDVGSLTKVLATTAVAMVLVDQGRLDLDSHASRYLPGFRGDGKDDVTVADLLRHRGGLSAWYPLFLHTADRAEAVEIASRRPLAAPPGATRIYSDLGFVLVGAILEALTGERLDAAAARLVFAPLGMADTCFLPDAGRQVAATSTGNPAERRMVAALQGQIPDRADGSAAPWREHTLVGEVNDANAAQAMSGVAGHAGVFSTAPDVGRFARALLHSGTVDGNRVWSAEVVARFLQSGRDPDQGLGFWLRRASAALGRAVPGDDSCGHRGFTGCEVAASPAGGWIAVLLSNRLHTDTDPPTDHRGMWRTIVGVARRPVQAAVRPGRHAHG